MCCLNVNLAFLNGFSVLLTSFIVVVVVVLLMLIFLLQSFILFYFFIELYSAHLIYAVAMFFDMPILYFMALSYVYNLKNNNNLVMANIKSKTLESILQDLCT